jgi:hypothetical protein
MLLYLSLREWTTVGPEGADLRGTVWDQWGQIPIVFISIGLIDQLYRGFAL